MEGGERVRQLVLPGKVVVSTAAFHFLQFKVQVRQLQLTRRLHPALERAEQKVENDGKQSQKGLKSNWQVT